MTPKQRQFATKYGAALASDPVNASAAAVYSEVYPAVGDSAKSSAMALLSRPFLREMIMRELYKVCPPAFLMRDLLRLTHARRGVWHDGMKVGSEPEHSVRLEAVRTMLKVYGAGENDAQPSVSVNFNIASVDPQRLADLADRMERLASRLQLPDGSPA